MCSLQMMMLKGEEIRHTHYENELDSMKKMMKELSSMPTEQTLGDPTTYIQLVGTDILIGHIKITIRKLYQVMLTKEFMLRM